MNQLEKVDLPLMWNVIDANTFQKRAQNVFTEVANVLKNTLGPYGTTTIIERTGEYHITKDGWNVLKNIHFSDRVEESILQLIINIASQVVIRVGDGSTSSVVASSYLYDKLKDIVGSARPKEIIQRLNHVVKEITKVIEKNSIKIDKNDTTYEDIYRIAYISTNGDEKVARIIQSLYQETGSPDIEYKNSRDGEHSYEVIEGYQSKIRALDPIYYNSGETTGKYNDLITILFDHRVEMSSHMEFMNDIIEYSNANNKPIFISAPGYDKQYLDWLKTVTYNTVQMGRPLSIIAGYSTLLGNFDHSMYSDLAVFTGGRVVTESTILAYNKKIYKQIEGSDEQEIVRENPDMKGTDYIGYVEEITLGKELSIFRGFPKLNKDLLAVHLRDAKNKLDEIEQREREYGIVNHEINYARERMTRLSCKLGIFHIGGHSTLEKNSDKDLIEDAVKATASAYKYGYNIGNNLAIQIAIKELLETGTLDELDAKIATKISEAFDLVLLEVYRNWKPDTDLDVVDNIKVRAFSHGESFNLETESFGNDIINPTYTDIEILHGAVSIISLIINSNQYVATQPEFFVKEGRNISKIEEYVDELRPFPCTVVNDSDKQITIINNSQKPVSIIDNGGK